MSAILTKINFLKAVASVVADSNVSLHLQFSNGPHLTFQVWLSQLQKLHLLWGRCQVHHDISTTSGLRYIDYNPYQGLLMTCRPCQAHTTFASAVSET